MMIETQIKDFIARNILFSSSGFRYSDDSSFLQEGIIDSLGVMELVAFVEKTFEVKVDDHDITPDNFDSVRKLTAYVQRLSGAVAG
jgi:acyl carrier protein